MEFHTPHPRSPDLGDMKDVLWAVHESLTVCPVQENARPLRSPGLRAGRMAKSVMCFPCKHKDLSSDPQHPHTRMDVAVGTSNPSNREPATGAHWLGSLA